MSSGGAIPAASVVLQLERELDVVGEGRRLIVVKGVVQDGENALRRRRVRRVRDDGAESQSRRRQLAGCSAPKHRDVEGVVPLVVHALGGRRDRVDERDVRRDLGAHF